MGNKGRIHEDIMDAQTGKENTKRVCSHMTAHPLMYLWKIIPG